MTENRRGGIRKIEQSRGMLNKKRFKRRTEEMEEFLKQREKECPEKKSSSSTQN